MRIEASFVRSAANASDLPRDGLAEVALVGRSNVGKSSLINALARTTIARTSATPGKTRLANVYRFGRMYVIDLPGYGYARGAHGEFDTLARAYFGLEGPDGLDRQDGKAFPAGPASPARPARRAALLVVDARHPGLEIDREAWRWLRRTVERCAVVANKIDKLSRAERQRALKTNDAAFEQPVLPVSADTGEGLDELWTLIAHLSSRSNPR